MALDDAAARRVLRIAKQIFEGLEFMDRIGYCHRDIKPENIGFVRHPGVEDADLKLKPGDGRAEHLDQISVKLIDFGVAWRYREGMSKQTWWIGELTQNLEAPEEYARTCTDAVRGSQGHMAPEVRPLRTYRPLCTRTDVQAPRLCRLLRDTSAAGNHEAVGGGEE